MKKFISAVLVSAIVLSCLPNIAYATVFIENSTNQENMYVEEAPISKEAPDNEYCALADFGRIVYVPASMLRKTVLDSKAKIAISQAKANSTLAADPGYYVFWLDWELHPPVEEPSVYDPETGEMIPPDNSAWETYEAAYAELIEENKTSLAEIDVTGVETTGEFDELPTAQLSSSASFTISLKTDGTVWAWGANEFGQCGPNYDPEQGVAQIPGLTNIKEVAAGWTFGVALDNNGDVWTWGSNLQGELGDGTTTTRPTPQKVNGLPAIKSISAPGMAHAVLAVGENNSLWYWGKVGQLSSEEPASISVPISTSTNAPVQIKKLAYAYGDYLNCLVGVDTEGTVWEWDLADVQNDQLGTPDATAGDPPASNDVVAGHNFVAVRSNDGHVYTKGKNEYGELGTGIEGASKQYSPVLRGDGTTMANVGSISAGCSNLFLFVSEETTTCGYYTGNACFRGGNPYGTGKSLYPISLGMYGNGDGATLASGGMCFTITAVKGQCYEMGFGKNDHNCVGLPSNIKKVTEFTRVNSSPIPKIVRPNAPAIVVSNFSAINSALAPIKTVEIYREDGAVFQAPVTWQTGSIQYTTYNGKSIAMVMGTVDYSGIPNGNNPAYFYASPVATFYLEPLKIKSIVQPKEVEVARGVSPEKLLEQLPQSIEFVEDFRDVSGLSVPVQWNTESFDFEAPVGTVQTLTGELILNGGITNPNSIAPEISVKMVNGDKRVVKVQLTVSQNVYLTPMIPVDVPEDYGLLDSIDLPETVTVTGGQAEVPVIWNVEGYDPTLVDVQTFDGQLVLPDGLNSVESSAELEITVCPKTYQVIDAIAMREPLEVYPGTTFTQMNAQAQAKELLAYVLAIDLETDLEVITLCPISFVEGDNPDFTKDVPGEYALTARLPDNFQSLEDPDTVASATVMVNVLEPLTIIDAENARMDAYQSVSHQELEGIPTQVNVTLENDAEIPVNTMIPVNVEWNWTEYELAKDVPGEHIVSGRLVDLPSMAVQPEDAEVIPVMIVNTRAVDYQITGVLSDNFYEADAGLTLEELTAILDPTLTFEITSTTEGINVVTSRTVSVTLEDAKNPDYTPEVDGYYPLIGTLDLPSNIICPSTTEGDPYEQINLFTNPVNVVSVEPAYILADEGTPFADLTGLPTQVIVTLSSVDAEGNSKTITTGVDWGTGEGYTPFPEGLTDDSPVTMEVTGTLADYPAYVNGAGVEAVLFVTMTRVYDLIAVTPGRIPGTGVIKVNLGSTLEDIYAQVESHSVELTLQNRKGETHTANVTFQLREDENAGYNPLTLGTHTLTGYLPLPENVKNPDDLGVDIAVQTMKYTISSSKVVRITNVPSGTPFEEIGLPELVTVVRNDGDTDDIPVTWNSDNYDPTKLGSQAVRGTLVTPLPVHLENPNKRQPNAIITVVNPSAQILSLKQLPQEMMLFSAALNDRDTDDNTIPGFTEYRYLAEILWEDGTTTFQVVSVFVETETA